ncbi:hypothetical protein LSH36_581g00001 [Paralvinella palmiformis]|uniref:Neurotransmitter-gated ion-channel ligand-binding domain-containing protein n=1 Tax=Paralvinella palmiformis TaxID=53620 RepID=A0AAD9MV20_9ANNE|nr:hypothetical protein LSH36_581g00001 [Paralvinella palmiformis]
METVSVNWQDNKKIGLQTLPRIAYCAAAFRQKDVYVRVVFIKIGEINTIQETFFADTFVQARWRESKLDGDGEQGEERDLPEWEKYWNPHLYVDNCLGEPKESVWYQVHYDGSGLAYVVQKRRIKATFFEKMELNSYPFDTQDLSLCVTTHRGEDEIEIVSDPSELSTVNTQSFVSEQEWTLHKYISSWVKMTTDVYRSTKNKHPAVYISCKASRRFNFFVWNIILIMIFIGILIFTTFAVSIALVQNRLQLSFILLLSNITFKFNISQTLPKVSYLTLLDKYVIVQIAMMCLVCLWHTTVFLVYDNHSQNLAVGCDRVGFGVLLGLYVLFQFTFFLNAVYLIKKKGKLIQNRDKGEKDMWSKIHRKESGIRQTTPVTMTASTIIDASNTSM